MKKRIFSTVLAVLMALNTFSTSVTGDVISSGDDFTVVETTDGVQQEESNQETEQETAAQSVQEETVTEPAQEETATESAAEEKLESASEKEEAKTYPAISTVQDVVFEQEYKTVSFDAEASEGVFEEGTSISVSEAAQSDAVDAAVQAVRESGKLSFLADEFDITPLLNGEKVQPNGNVTLTFGYADMEDILSQANDYLIEQILDMLEADPEDEETYAEYVEYVEAYIEQNDLAITKEDLNADVYHIYDAGKAEKLTSTTPETCEKLPNAQYIISTSTDSFSEFVVEVAFDDVKVTDVIQSLNESMDTIETAESECTHGWPYDTYVTITAPCSDIGLGQMCFCGNCGVYESVGSWSGNVPDTSNVSSISDMVYDANGSTGNGIIKSGTFTVYCPTCGKTYTFVQLPIMQLHLQRNLLHIHMTGTKVPLQLRLPVFQQV